MTQTQTASTHPGQIAWSQIRFSDKMAVGAREPILGDPSINGTTVLCFRVLRANRWIEIALDATDTYTVTLIRLKRGSTVRIVVGTESLIYADQLSGTVYRVACS